MAYGKRSTTFNPWHYCARCDEKTHISEMTWQRGKLLCNKNCIDKMLIGGRETEIANVLGDGKVELQLAAKLREPDTESGNEDIFQP